MKIVLKYDRIFLFNESNLSAVAFQKNGHCNVVRGPLPHFKYSDILLPEEYLT